MTKENIKHAKIAKEKEFEVVLVEVGEGCASESIGHIAAILKN